MNETACGLFDDSGLEFALEKNAITLSPEIDGEFRELRWLLWSCLKRQRAESLEAILASPDWREVRGRAARLLSKLAARQAS